MQTIFFFDIPIYIKSEDKYSRELTNYIDKNLNKNNSIDIQMLFRKEYVNRFGGHWRFNAIIGYIRLHFLGTQIRGEYYGLDAKRITRKSKATFKFITHKLAPELEIGVNRDSDYIFLRVIEYLTLCSKEQILKGRHIDLSVFNTLKNHINWSSLYGQ